MSSSDSRLNLSKTSVLIVQINQVELDILGQVLIGFGVKAIRKCGELSEAEEAVRRGAFDLILVDGDMPGGAGFDFVSRVRRLEDSPNRLAPILLVSGHTPPGAVTRARDSGANFIVTKPIMPKIMFDRIMWLARETRQFVESENYVGPDRRHKAFGPPPGEKGRRHDDLSADIGRPSGPDMCQADIDAMFSPKRAVT